MLVVGGYNGSFLASTEIYDPARETFTEGPTMMEPRIDHSAVVLSDGKVFITGGADERDDQGQYRDAELYDGAVGRFTVVGPAADALG